jgi:hypothetical protein
MQQLDITAAPHPVSVPHVLLVETLLDAAQAEFVPAEAFTLRPVIQAGHDGTRQAEDVPAACSVEDGLRPRRALAVIRGCLLAHRSPEVVRNADAVRVLSAHYRRDFLLMCSKVTNGNFRLTLGSHRTYEGESAAR